MFYSASPQVGLDIQSSYLSIVVVNKGKVVKAYSQPFAEEIMLRGQIARFDILCSTLQQVIDRLSLNNYHVNIQISHTIAYMKALTLPSGLTSDEIKHEIYYDLKHRSNCKEEVQSSYLIERHSNWMDVFFVAVNAVYLQQLTQAIEACGCVVRSIDVDVYAFKRIVKVTLGEKISEKLTVIGVQYDSNFNLVYLNRHQILSASYFNLKNPNEVAHLANICKELNEHSIIISANVDQLQDFVPKYVTKISLNPVFNFNHEAIHRLILAYGLALKTNHDRN